MNTSTILAVLGCGALVAFILFALPDLGYGGAHRLDGMTAP